MLWIAWISSAHKAHSTAVTLFGCVRLSLVLKQIVESDRAALDVYASNSKLKAQLHKRMLNFISYNSYHLNMYARPGLIWGETLMLYHLKSSWYSTRIAYSSQNVLLRFFAAHLFFFKSFSLVAFTSWSLLLYMVYSYLIAHLWKGNWIRLRVNYDYSETFITKSCVLSMLFMLM